MHEKASASRRLGDALVHSKAAGGGGSGRNPPRPPGRSDGKGSKATR